MHESNLGWRLEHYPDRVRKNWRDQLSAVAVFNCVHLF